MINVNKITSTLAKLPDQQLQQYAQMHKSDPYIMALAMSESNRRKEMRAAGQGAQGMQEQPKVVDQMVAEMAPQQLPEDQGIGQLPAGNMNFAGGGIIAFADGGDVERYQSQGLVQPRARWEDALAELQAPPQESSALGRSITDFFTRSDDLDAIRQNARTKQAQGLPLSAQEKAVLQADAQPNPAASRQPSALEQERTRNMQQVANEGYTRGDPRAQLSMPSGAEQLKAVSTAPTADTGRKDTERKDTKRKDAAATDTSAKTDTGGLDSIIKDFTRQTDLAIGARRNALAELASNVEQIPKNRAERNAKEREKEGDVFAGREARLAAREKGIEGMGDKYLGLALLQAGAAMMSTPGNIGTVLGKGIQVGSDRYVAGIDKINTAKDKFAEARDRLEDLRLNRADMTKKEIREEQRDIDNGVLQAKKLFADGLDNDLKVTADAQKAIFGAVAERENVMLRERGANTRAAGQNRNSQLETLRAVQADPSLAAVARAMSSKGGDVMGEYNDFLKANPALAMNPQEAMVQFLRTKAVFSQLGGGTVTDKPSTKVRTQP